VKLITGAGEPMIGRMLVYDAIEMTFRTLKVRKDPECPACGKNPTVTELIDYEAFCGVTEDVAEFAAQLSITPPELKALRDRGEAVALIDVREPHEWDIVNLDGSTLIPMAQVVERVSEIPQDGTVVVLCKVGARSAEVLRWLHSIGLTHAKHLHGGLDAWARQVDPSMPRY
jgi:adenylyltransferase/sulfurtransferase